jgi:hypothetical protein
LKPRITTLEIANMINNNNATDGNSGTVAGEEVGVNWVGWDVAEGAIVDLGAVVGVTVGVTVGATVGEVEGVVVGVAPNAITTIWLL